jgi:hypothetical protein
MPRPPHPTRPFEPLPTRNIGRISSEDWEAYKAAAYASGKTLSEWIRETLTRAAKRQAKASAEE